MTNPKFWVIHQFSILFHWHLFE